MDVSAISMVSKDAGKTATAKGSSPAAGAVSKASFAQLLEALGNQTSALPAAGTATPASSATPKGLGARILSKSPSTDVEIETPTPASGDAEAPTVDTAPAAMLALVAPQPAPQQPVTPLAEDGSFNPEVAASLREAAAPTDKTEHSSGTFDEIRALLAGENEAPVPSVETVAQADMPAAPVADAVPVAPPAPQSMPSAAPTTSTDEMPVQTVAGQPQSPIMVAALDKSVADKAEPSSATSNDAQPDTVTGKADEAVEPIEALIDQPVEAASTIDSTAIETTSAEQVDAQQAVPTRDALSAPTAQPAAATLASAPAMRDTPPAAPAATQPLPETVLATRPERLPQDLGLEIARSVHAGKTEIAVRLDPADLGRIDIRLEVDTTGEVRAVIAAENPGTYDLLRRDADTLARTLSDAGLKADAGSFRFDLRQDQPQQQARQDQPQHASRHSGWGEAGGDGDAKANPEPAQSRQLGRSGRFGAVDLIA